MSQQRKRTDLIERTRYPNPLPLPPYPPKLLSIPTPAERYANPIWSSRLADTVPFPLVVDAEGGMPLDLNSFPELWAVDSRGRPLEDPHPPSVDSGSLHAEDAWLLSADLANAPAPPPVPSAISNGVRNNGIEIDASTQTRLGGTSTPQAEELSARDVAWLRRTEYIGADRKAKAAEAVKAARPLPGASKDTSPAAEAARIQSTFQAISAQPLQDPTLRHPTKKDLRPVECYDLFPDFSTWATDLHVFKFNDVPGKHDDGTSTSQGPLGQGGRDARLPLSLFRPRKDPLTGRHMISFFLPTSTPASDVTLREFDEILLRDPDAFDDEDREFFAEQAGQLDDSVREAAIVRREEQRRRKGWTGALPEEPEPAEGEDEVSEEALAELARARAEVCTPYAHQRDYDPERQGNEEDLNRLLVLSFAEQATSDLEKSLPLLQSEESYLAASSSSGSSASSSVRPGQSKAAYYHPIKSRTALRVKRSRRRNEYGSGPGGDDDEYWPAVALTHRDVTQRELVKRLRKRAEVDAVKLDELPELSESEAESDEEEEGEADGTELPDSKQAAGEESDAEGDTAASTKPRPNGRVATSSSSSSPAPPLPSSSSALAQDSKAEDAAARARARAAAKAAFSDDDEEDQDGDAARPTATVAAAAESKAKEVGQEEEEDADDDDEDSDDDDEDEDDESIDADEELAALREEAGGEGDEVMAEAGDDGAGGGGGGRSRRSRATAAAPREPEADDGSSS